MNQTYYTVLTQKGVALLDNATSLGVPLKITQMAVGDGNGNITTPDATQTELVHEVRRAAIDKLFVDNENPCQIIAEQVIPETDGGWFIHEIGLFDDKDNLIAVGNYPATYKPNCLEDSSRTQVIRMEFIVDNTEAIELKNETIEVFAARKYIEPRADATQTTATQKYVNDTITAKITAHEKSTNHPNATTSNKGFVQLNSEIDSKLETQAATPLAVKKVYDVANGAVKRSGDTMTGLLTLSNKGKGLKIDYLNKDSMTLMTSSDRYSHVFYDAKTNRSERKLDYNSTENIWQFRNVNDVTINDKSVLKAGDYGIGTDAGAPLSDPEKRLHTGFYGIHTNQLSLPNASGYGTLAVYGSDGPYTKYVEQLYIADSWTPRLFSRCGFLDLTKRAWVESITEANIDRFLTAPVGVPQPWPRSFAPKGYLLCNGASFDANKYPKLSYAYPDGKLPDLRKWDANKDIQFIYIVKAE